MYKEKIVASRELCWQLSKIGLDTPSVFVWCKNGANPEHWIVELSAFANGYEIIPAWTKEELDVMTGPRYAKADQVAPNDVSKSVPEYWWPVYYPKTMRVFEKGADAAADALLFLITEKRFTAQEAKTRYLNTYQL
jgi:hypothetical protein